MAQDSTVPRRAIAARELTVGEVRAWLKALANPDPEQEIDLADWLLYQDDGLRLSDFTRLSRLSPEELETLTEADLDALLARAKEVNPRFFTALAQVRNLGLMVIRENASTNSKKPAPASRNWFARMFGRGPGAG